MRCGMLDAMSGPSCEVKPFPKERHDVVDALEVGVRRHMVHALLEFDVTRARELLRGPDVAAGERLSFTAFIVASLARAIDADRRLHAYRDWAGRLFFRALRRNPRSLKRVAGTTLVTSVGMFGMGQEIGRASCRERV